MVECQDTAYALLVKSLAMHQRAVDVVHQTVDVAVLEHADMAEPDRAPRHDGLLQFGHAGDVRHRYEIKAVERPDRPVHFLDLPVRAFDQFTNLGRLYVVPALQCLDTTNDDVLAD